MIRCLVAAFLLVSCVTAEEDEIASLEKQIRELERELETCVECQTDLSLALYEKEVWKNMAEDCLQEE